MVSVHRKMWCYTFAVQLQYKGMSYLQVGFREES